MLLHLGKITLALKAVLYGVRQGLRGELHSFSLILLETGLDDDFYRFSLTVLSLPSPLTPFHHLHSELDEVSDGEEGEDDPGE